MTRRAWVRLDNASNIFLAARTHADPKVFRISAETDHEVDPHLLQQALDDTYDRYPLYHAVLRRGVFWYYLQDSDLRPVVTADELHTCSASIRQTGAICCSAWSTISGGSRSRCSTPSPMEQVPCGSSRIS